MSGLSGSLSALTLSPRSESGFQVSSVFASHTPISKIALMSNLVCCRIMEALECLPTYHPIFYVERICQSYNTSN